jgi:hypothetical protein
LALLSDIDQPMLDALDRVPPQLARSSAGGTTLFKGIVIVHLNDKQEKRKAVRAFEAI